jgi:hypothetical protein
MASNYSVGPYQLVGLRLDTGAEVSRTFLNKTFMGRIFFDDDTRNLIAMCKPVESVSNWTFCKIDPVTGGMEVIAPGSETLKSWAYFGDMAFDASNQMYFATLNGGFVAFSVLTGKIVAGPFTQQVDLVVAMTKFQCFPLTLVIPPHNSQRVSHSVSQCLYVCMYVCMYVYVMMLLCLHIMYVCMYVYVYIYIYIMYMTSGISAEQDCCQQQCFT